MQAILIKLQNVNQRISLLHNSCGTRPELEKSCFRNESCAAASDNACETSGTHTIKSLDYNYFGLVKNQRCLNSKATKHRHASFVSCFSQKQYKFTGP